MYRIRDRTPEGTRGHESMRRGRYKLLVGGDDAVEKQSGRASAGRVVCVIFARATSSGPARVIVKTDRQYRAPRPFYTCV